MSRPTPATVLRSRASASPKIELSSVPDIRESRLSEVMVLTATVAFGSLGSSDDILDASRATLISLEVIFAVN